MLDVLRARADRHIEEVRIFKLDAACVGRIIGRRGSTIQGLQSKFPGTFIVLDSQRSILILLGAQNSNATAEAELLTMVPGQLHQMDLPGEIKVVLHCSAKTSGASSTRRAQEAHSAGHCVFGDEGGLYGMDHVDRKDAIERIKSVVRFWDKVFVVQGLQVARDGNYPVRFALVGTPQDVFHAQEGLARRGIYLWHHYSMDVMGLSEPLRAQFFDSVYLSRPVVIPSSVGGQFLRLENEEISRLPDVMLALGRLVQY